MKSRIGSSTIVLEALPGTLAMPDEFARVPDSESRQEELVLRQRKGLFMPWRQLVLFNEHYVEFRDGAGRNIPRVLNLAFLADQPAIVSAFPWRWLVVSLVLLGAASVTALFREWLLLTAFSLAFVISLSVYFARAQQRLLFRTRYGGVVVFDIFHGIWQRRKAAPFVELLRQRITQASSRLPSGEARLAIEVAEHRRFQQDGWLSRSRYEQAKKRLFSQYKRQPKTGSERVRAGLER